MDVMELANKFAAKVSAGDPVALGSVALIAGVVVLSGYLFMAHMGDGKPRLGRGKSGAASADPLRSAKTVTMEIGAATDLPQVGEMKSFTVKKPTGSILVVRTSSGELRAMPNKCTHYNIPFLGKAGGVLSGDRVMCPAHAACFNVDTGDIEDGPGMDNLPLYDIEVRDGRAFVTLPVTAANKLIVRRKPCRHPVAAPGATAGGDIVIIGCGAAAAGAVETLLASGHAGSITVVSKDTAGFWDRVKVSKNVTADDHSERSKVIDPAEWAAAGVTLLFGHEVTSVSTADRAVYCAPVDGGKARSVPYDKLLCASGGPARAFGPDERFSLEGADLDNIFVLRDARDNGAVYAAVNEFRDSERGARVVIVGSSFIGMEAAKSLAGEAAEGLVSSIDVIGMETEPFERVLGVEVGAAMRRAHHLHAAQCADDCDGDFELRFHMQSKTTSFEGTGAVRGVRVSHSDGSEELLEADVVVIGSGMIPAVQYLTGTEARIGNGVRVDDTLKACDHVWAAGDIAEMPNTRFTTCDRDAFVRIEHWDSAIDQGRCAARNMLQELAGRPGSPFDTVPFFWTAQPGVNIRYAGHCHFVTPEDTVVHGDLDSDRPSATVFYCSGPKVLAVATLNNDPEAVAASELFRLGAMPSREVVESSHDLSLAGLLSGAA